MTEDEWLKCEKPDLLLRHLKAIGATRRPRGQLRRKIRLLACAAFGPVRHLLRKEYGCRAIELGERYADGVARPDELVEFYEKLRAAALPIGTPQWNAEQMVQILVNPGNDLAVAEIALDYALYALEREANAAKPNL